MDYPAYPTRRMEAVSASPATLVFHVGVPLYMGHAERW